MVLPVGTGGGPREQPKAGASGAYLLGIWYVGLHHSEYMGEKKKTQKCVAVFEIDQRMSDGKRFLLNQEVTLSANEKAHLRKTYGPVFAPDSFSWSNDEWANCDAVRFRDEVKPGNFTGPCRVAIRTTRSDGSGDLKNATIDGMAVIPHGTDPMVPENNYDTDLPRLVVIKRGMDPEYPCASLVHYRPEDFDDTPPAHQSEVNKQAAATAKATALAPQDDIPWNDEEPQF